MWNNRWTWHLCRNHIAMHMVRRKEWVKWRAARAGDLVRKFRWWWKSLVAFYWILFFFFFCWTLAWLKKREIHLDKHSNWSKSYIKKKGHKLSVGSVRKWRSANKKEETGAAMQCPVGWAPHKHHVTYNWAEEKSFATSGTVLASVKLISCHTAVNLINKVNGQALLTAHVCAY